MKRLPAVLAALLLAAAPLTARAAEDAVYTCDFENMTTDVLRSAEPLGLAEKNGSITVETLDGRGVLRFMHPQLEANEDCFLDILGGKTESCGLNSVYCLSYDFLYTGELGTPWQILCSRQTPESGLYFQQVGYIGEGGTITAHGVSGALAALEPDRWYTLSAVMNEADNFYDLYIDGALVAEAVPYSIQDPSALLPERIRIGFAGGTGAATAYIDNIRLTNSAFPDNMAQPDIRLLPQGGGESGVFPLPVYEKNANVSRPVWIALGSAASVALAAVGAALVRRLGREKPES